MKIKKIKSKQNKARAYELVVGAPAPAYMATGGSFFDPLFPRGVSWSPELVIPDSELGLGGKYEKQVLSRAHRWKNLDHRAEWRKTSN